MPANPATLKYEVPSGLHCHFEFERSADSRPDHGTVTIYNLSPQTVQNIATEGAFNAGAASAGAGGMTPNAAGGSMFLTVEACYGFNPTTAVFQKLFEGDIAYCDTHQETVDRVTTIEVQDGGLAMAANWVVISAPESSAKLGDLVTAGIVGLLKSNGGQHLQVSNLSKGMLAWLNLPQQATGQWVTTTGSDLHPMADNAEIATATVANPIGVTVQTFDDVNFGAYQIAAKAAADIGSQNAARLARELAKEGQATKTGNITATGHVKSVGRQVKNKNQTTPPRGFCVLGRPRKVIDDLLEKLSWSWSITNGIIELWPPFIARVSDPLPINAAVGMVGSPDISRKKDVSVKTLLNPQMFQQLLPHQVVRLSYHDYTKPDPNAPPKIVNAVINSIRLNGDNFGGDWFAQITSATQLSAPYDGKGRYKPAFSAFGPTNYPTGGV